MTITAAQRGWRSKHPEVKAAERVRYYYQTKGYFKALLNGARSAQWNRAGEQTFIAAEDLSCQPGLALQQDTALVTFLGIGHAERNGHH